MDGSIDPFPPGIPWTPVMNSQNPAQQLALQVSGSLSIAGAIFIMSLQLVCCTPYYAARGLGKLLVLVLGDWAVSICVIAFKGLQYHWKDNLMTRRMLFWISLSDALCAASWIFGSTIVTPVETPNLSCVIQAFLLQYTLMASACWTACFAFLMFQLLWMQHEDSSRFHLWFHAFSWGLPLLLLIYFMVRQSEGLSRNMQCSMGDTERTWCWIRSVGETTNEWSSVGSLQQLLLFYVPMFIIFVFDLAVYLFLVSKLGHLVSDAMERRIRNKMLQYLAVFALLSVWSFANRILQIFSKHHLPNEALVIMECIFGPSQGLLNALVYGVDDEMWMIVRRFLCACCDYGALPPRASITALQLCCCKRHSNSTVYTDEEKQQPLLP